MYYEATLPYYDCGDDDCGDVKRRQVRSTESSGASEVQWTEQEYRIEPSCRSSRQARLTILRLWRRHAPVSSEPSGSIVSALLLLLIVNYQRPRVVRAVRLV